MKLHHLICLILMLITILFSPIALSSEKIADKLGLSYFIF